MTIEDAPIAFCLGSRSWISGDEVAGLFGSALRAPDHDEFGDDFGYDFGYDDDVNFCDDNNDVVNGIDYDAGLLRRALRAPGHHDHDHDDDGDQEACLIEENIVPSSVGSDNNYDHEDDNDYHDYYDDMLI